MADVKISALTALTGANLATDDVFPVVDTSATATKKITVQELITGILGSTSKTGATETTSKPLLDLAQTWNAGGVTFTGLKLNVTDTASDAASLLADFQVGGVSKFKVDKAGKATFAASADIENTAGAMVFGNPANGFSFRVQGAATGSSFASMSDTRMAVISTAAIGWTAGTDGWVTTALDTALYRDAAGVLAQRNGTNAQAFNIYNTYTDGSNYERGFFRWSSNALEIGTEAAGTGSARVIHLSGLPTSNPGPGILWNNAGTPAIGT